MSRVYGSKYDGSLSTAGIAKRIREDIRQEIRDGALPQGLVVSVRTHSYSMGSSITIHVVKVPDGFQIVNPGGDEGLLERDAGGVRRYAPNAQAVLDKLGAIARAYNHDGSDPMTDYYDVKFAQHVAYELVLEEEDRRRVRATSAASDAKETRRVVG